MPEVTRNRRRAALRWAGTAGLAVALLLSPALPAVAQLPHVEPLKVDLVVVRKSARKLQLLHAGRVIKTYRIALGWDPNGPKRQEGDGRTPEGVYTLDWRNAHSSFHRALHVSYPGAGDNLHAARWGVSPGGQIMLHGLPNGLEAEEIGHPDVDWTNGCIALTNDEIDEIWTLVDDGTTIIIYP
jgi:murein L,D-transpeptidase YafK